MIYKLKSQLTGNVGWLWNDEAMKILFLKCYYAKQELL